MRSPSRAPPRCSLGGARRSSTRRRASSRPFATAAKVTRTGCGPNASSTGPTPKTPSGWARPKIITLTVITLGRSCGGTRSVMQRVDRRVDEPVRDPGEAERDRREPGARARSSAARAATPGRGCTFPTSVKPPTRSSRNLYATTLPATAPTPNEASSQPAIRGSASKRVTTSTGHADEERRPRRVARARRAGSRAARAARGRGTAARGARPRPRPSGGSGAGLGTSVSRITAETT